MCERLGLFNSAHAGVLAQYPMLVRASAHTVGATTYPQSEAKAKQKD